MDLVHCQRCGVLPQYNPELRKPYYMTTCGHLFCEGCVRTFTDQCPQCQRNCRVSELNSQTPPEFKSMFADPMQVLKEAFARPAQILNFQKQLNKDKIRIMSKMMDSLKTLRTENTNLKGEIDRLRQVNEAVNQERNQLQLKVNELQMSGNRVSPHAHISPRNNQGQGSDPLDLFRDPTGRPNAQVQPISRHQYSTPLSIARTPARSTVSLDSTQSQQFAQQEGFSVVRFTRSSTASDSPVFATPSSSLSHNPFDSGQSPFFKHSGNGNPSAGLFGSGSAGMNIQSSSSSTPNKTPELINRLRNLKCKSTPSGDPSSRF